MCTDDANQYGMMYLYTCSGYSSWKLIVEAHVLWICEFERMYTEKNPRF